MRARARLDYARARLSVSARASLAPRLIVRGECREDSARAGGIVIAARECTHIICAVIRRLPGWVRASLTG